MRFLQVILFSYKSKRYEQRELPKSPFLHFMAISKMNIAVFLPQQDNNHHSGYYMHRKKSNYLPPAKSAILTSCLS